MAIGLTLGALGYLLRDVSEPLSLAAYCVALALYMSRAPTVIAALATLFVKRAAPQGTHPTIEGFSSLPAHAPGAGVVKALFVLGASPGAAQSAPIIEQMGRDARFEARVCIATQSADHPERVLELFDLVPDVRVTLADDVGDDAQVTSAALGGIDRVLHDFQPDIVLVPGSAPTSVATALAATYQHIPVISLEPAGASAPHAAQDATRKVMGSLAALHFTATESIGRSLIADGVPSERVLVTGDPAARTLHTAVERMHNDEGTLRRLTQRFGFLREDAPLLLVLGREKMGERLEPLARALRRIALRRPDIDVICLMPPSRNMDGIDGMLGAFANIHLVAPDEYLDFAYLADAAYLVLAVAGDVAAEAAPLGKPVLLLNNGPESGAGGPLTSETPNVRRVDIHEQTISDVVLNLISDRHAWELLRNPEQPRVDACERIVEALAALRPTAGTVVPLAPVADLARYASGDRMREVS